MARLGIELCFITYDLHQLSGAINRAATPKAMYGDCVVLDLNRSEKGGIVVGPFEGGTRGAPCIILASLVNLYTVQLILQPLVAWVLWIVGGVSLRIKRSCQMGSDSIPFSVGGTAGKTAKQPLDLLPKLVESRSDFFDTLRGLTFAPCWSNCLQVAELLRQCSLFCNLLPEFGRECDG